MHSPPLCFIITSVHRLRVQKSLEPPTDCTIGVRSGVSCCITRERLRITFTLVCVTRKNKWITHNWRAGGMGDSQQQNYIDIGSVYMEQWLWLGEIALTETRVGSPFITLYWAHMVVMEGVPASHGDSQIRVWCFLPRLLINTSWEHHGDKK